MRGEGWITQMCVRFWEVGEGGGVLLWGLDVLDYVALRLCLCVREY